MIREILELGNPLLRAVSAEVGQSDVSSTACLVTDLIDTLHDFQLRTGYGRGIAAPQIGALVRMVVIDPLPDTVLASGTVSDVPVTASDRPVTYPLILANPSITYRSPQTILVWDACFSFWGFFFQVRRARRVTVDYTDVEGRPQRLKAEGDLAELFQHEIDHLDGVLAIDLIADPGSLCTIREYEKRTDRRPSGSAG